MRDLQYEVARLEARLKRADPSPTGHGTSPRDGVPDLPIEVLAPDPSERPDGAHAPSADEEFESRRQRRGRRRDRVCR